MLKQFSGSLTDVSGSSEHEDQRSQRAGHTVESDLVADVSESIDRHMRVVVVVGESHVQERSVVAQRQKSKADSVEDVDEAGVSSPLSEHHKSFSLLVDNLLIVQKTDVLEIGE